MTEEQKLKIIVSYSYVEIELCGKVEIEHLAEDMSKPSVDGAARFLRAAFRKM